MDRRPGATSLCRFLGTLANTFRATWTWHRWTSAFENSPLNVASNPGKPSTTPRTTLEASNPRRFRFPNNSL